MTERYGPKGLTLKPLRKPPKRKDNPVPMEDHDWGAPTVSISSERLKEVEGWKVGGRYMLEAEQIGMRTTDERGEKCTIVELKIIKAGSAGKKN